MKPSLYGAKKIDKVRLIDEFEDYNVLGSKIAAMDGWLRLDAEKTLRSSSCAGGGCAIYRSPQPSSITSHYISPCRRHHVSAMDLYITAISAKRLLWDAPGNPVITLPPGGWTMRQVEKR